MLGYAHVENSAIVREGCHPDPLDLLIMARNRRVEIFVRGLALSDDDAIDQAHGNAVNVIDTRGTANEIHISEETVTVTIDGNAHACDFVNYKIRRDAAIADGTSAIDTTRSSVQTLHTNGAVKDGRCLP